MPEINFLAKEKFIFAQLFQIISIPSSLSLSKHMRKLFRFAFVETFLHGKTYFSYFYLSVCFSERERERKIFSNSLLFSLAKSAAYQMIRMKCFLNFARGRPVIRYNLINYEY